MKPATIRTSIDIPQELHRQVRKLAATKGCSARKLILTSIERIVEEENVAQPRRRLRLERGLIRPAGRRIDLTNDQIYDLIEFP